MTRAATLVLACCGAAACAYYNGMWSAEHLAKEARQLERQDRLAEARTYWAQAAVKAESVVARHPKSRWASDALVLQGEALARSGACPQAAAPLARAVTTVRDEALRERAELATAECALAENDAAAASRALAGVTGSHDAGRRSHAALLAGRSAVLAGDPASAADWFRRSDAPGAAPARVRALLAAGRVADALVLTDTVARDRFREEAWAALLADVRRAADAGTASQTLDRMLARGRTPAGARGRLLLADGDALLAAKQTAVAAARYAQVAALVPDSSEGQLARVRALRVLAVDAESVPALALIEQRLQRLVESGPAGAAAGEGRALAALVRRIRHHDDLSEIARFRLAEVVRDSLGAPHLAGLLFLEFAGQAPTSLFAPKALLAAAALWPERRDSIAVALGSRYAGSPYTLALRGEFSPAFAAAEDSLARALGLALAPPTALFRSRVRPPVPGPRGPLLDPPPALPSALAVAGPPPAPPTPRAQPRPARPRPASVGDQDERPVVQPDTL